MIVKSFIKDYFGLKPVDVEVVFTTGLPQISILGLPDKIIQESTKRIQTALVAQGYQMPKAKHVLVNLWPREIRKTSLGVDLAIALGILAESGQKDIFSGRGPVSVYGELTLSGEVRAPKDIEAVTLEHGPVITGGPMRSYDFPVSILENLRAECILSEPQSSKFLFERPKSKYKSFLNESADLLLITAVGEHSVLLAGPPGSGKTSFVETVPCLLKEPGGEVFQQSRNIARYFGSPLAWRPVMSPHHSTPAVSMLGGGVPPRPGVIVRAHGGVLILDELLEFDPKVQSALREALETGRVSIARGLQLEEFPSNFLTLATTNLCKCGDYVPAVQNRCRCSSLQLRRYIERLTGPFVDRFTILQFTQSWSNEKSPHSKSMVSIETLLEKSQKVRDFIFSSRKQHEANENLSLDDIQKSVKNKNLLETFEAFRSHRRRLAFWRVARTLADLEFSEMIHEKHLVRSQAFTVGNFSALKNM